MKIVASLDPTIFGEILDFIHAYQRIWGEMLDLFRFPESHIELLNDVILNYVTH